MNYHSGVMVDELVFVYHCDEYHRYFEDDSPDIWIVTIGWS